jgi:hypothetical protein
MFRRIASIGILGVTVMVSRLFAQARTESAPTDNYLLRITQDWGRESFLGDTRKLNLAPDDAELRVWGGYGLTATRGVVMRRIQDVWRGWAAEVHTCSLAVPIPVGDTASDVTAAAFRARARRECGRGHKDTLSAASIFSVDTLEVYEIRDAPGMGRAWEAAVKAGIFALPPQVKRAGMLDGFVYVIELRHGSSYRASVIDLVEKPEFEADRQVQAIYRAVAPLLDAALARRR